MDAEASGNEGPKEMTPAKLPESLIAPEPRRISEASVGEHFRMQACDLSVSLDGSCYLEPGAKLTDTNLPPLTIDVERREDGFHVTVSSKCRWKRSSYDVAKWIPVASITVKE